MLNFILRIDFFDCNEFPCMLSGYDWSALVMAVMANWYVALKGVSESLNWPANQQFDSVGKGKIGEIAPMRSLFI
jgi:hypothetical protein